MKKDQSEIKEKWDCAFKFGTPNDAEALALTFLRIGYEVKMSECYGQMGSGRTVYVRCGGSLKIL